MRNTVALIAWTTCLATALPAIGGGTQYHIRPFYNAGGGAVIDGLSENGGTAGGQGFSDSARTGRVAADLRTGELRAFNEINVPVSGFLIALTEFSETFNVRNAAGTNFSFDFDVEGSITADALSVAGNTYQIDMFANLAVFPAGVANWDTWFDLATNTAEDLFFQTIQYNALNPTTDINEIINDTISYSTTVGSHDESYHVFARIQIATNANTPQHVTMDFENTGSLGFTAAPGATVLSASGVFPGTGEPIPEPGTGVMMSLGLVAMLGRRRRRA